LIDSVVLDHAISNVGDRDAGGGVPPPFPGETPPTILTKIPVKRTFRVSSA